MSSEEVAEVTAPESLKHPLSPSNNNEETVEPAAKKSRLEPHSTPDEVVDEKENLVPQVDIISSSSDDGKPKAEETTEKDSANIKDERSDHDTGRDDTRDPVSQKTETPTSGDAADNAVKEEGCILKADEVSKGEVSKGEAPDENVVTMEDVPHEETIKDKCGPSRADEEDDEVLTVEEIIASAAEEEEMEEETRALLGACSDTECSYSLGYLTRQALYACLTCATEAEGGGVCLACVLKCHDGHDTVEMYTKRNFRCDCGNSLFPASTPCQRTPDKQPTNPDNKYDQTFRGLYCVCHRPYPDESKPADDTMIQCVQCEDWFHVSCLRKRHAVGPEDEFSEMICHQCMAGPCSVLRVYEKTLGAYYGEKEELGDAPAENKICRRPKDEEPDSTDGESANGEPLSQSASRESAQPPTEDGASHASFNPQPIKSPESNEEASGVTTDGNEMSSESANEDKTSAVSTNGDEVPSQSTNEDGKPSQSTNEDEAPSQSTNGEAKSSETVTKKHGPPKMSTNEEPGSDETATFWRYKWRAHICHCETCLNLYQLNDILFLADWDDSVAEYEARGRQMMPSADEKFQSNFNKLDRVSQMEAAKSMVDFSSKLKTFISDLAKQGKTVVTAQDVDVFVQSLKSGGDAPNLPPDSCR